MKKLMLIVAVLCMSLLVYAEAKIPYVQLAFKDGVCKKHISIERAKYTALIADNWVFVSFNSETDIPLNPILDNGTVRSKTTAEITAEIRSKKLARTVFSAQSIIEAIEAIDKENDNTALSSKLITTLSNNPAFGIYWGAYSSAVNLEHPVCVQALANFTAAEIETLKLKIP